MIEMRLKSYLSLGEIVGASDDAGETDLGEGAGETDLANDGLVCFAGRLCLSAVARMGYPFRQRST